MGWTFKIISLHQMFWQVISMDFSPKKVLLMLYLVHIIKEIPKLVGSGRGILITFLDLAKAFYLVDRSKLLWKPYTTDFKGQSIDFLKAIGQTYSKHGYKLHK